MDAFSRPLRLWFEQNFAAPTEAQARGWPVIASGAHCLLTAPTGSGKTLAAFLAAIDRLLQQPATGTRILYISPLKALAYDIERNLRAPLAGAAVAAAGLGLTPTLPRVGIRTGDTPAREREQQRKDPPEILVTTPESLYLLLGSRAQATLTRVETVIVDEVHALAPTKRGAHLALSLERLSRLCEAQGREPQRIGLSATVTPLAEAALWLGGTRAVTIVDAAAPPRLELTVTMPVAEMTQPAPLPWSEGGSESGAEAEAETDLGFDLEASGPILGELMAREEPQRTAQRAQERGLWAALHPALLEAILAHRSSIIFVNSRGLCERLCQCLNELYAEGAADPPTTPLVRAHHGSLSHPQRAAIEEALKRGELRAIVATSSLEMGIDMGAVDQVLLVESPGTVARGLQRVGRAGHAVGALSQGRIYPKFRGDLLECAVVGARMLRGELEPLRMPRLALDVLAQQLAASCVGASPSVADLHRLVTRAGPYRDLSRAALEAVLDMLSGRYPSSDFADLRPLLNWDRSNDVLSARKGAAMVTRLNGGTIPDRGMYAVHLPGGADGSGARIGELDEEMVFETRAGECILLGASTWRVEEITRDRVIVTPAPGEPGKLPFWRGDGPGRPVELGRAIGAFCRALSALVPPAPPDPPPPTEEAPWPPAAALDWIQAQTPLDRHAARHLAAYLGEQRAATGTVPSDRVIVCERFRDELGDWRICLLTPFGARIHGPWAMALQWQLARRAGFAIQVMWTDDGICLRLADGEELPDLADLLPAADAVEEMVTEQLAETALFASLFRENAGRALLLPRRSPQGRQPLWAQRLKAQNLLAAVRRYPAFPIVLETYRQALGEVFDLPGLKALLTAIAARQLRVHEVETRAASPFARALVFAYVAAFIYEQDAPLAERRAAALSLDRGLLAELLGQAELRALIDPLVLADLEQELQALTPTRRARDADELADLLRRLGDLNLAEITARCAASPAAADRRPADAATTVAAESDDAEDAVVAIDPQPWLQALAAQRRALSIRIAGEQRWISTEDAGRYRDALGVVPPPGLPAAFIAATTAPLEELLRRYARTHGPFPTAQAAARLGLRAAQIEPVLQLLETRGLLVRGELRPQGSTPEWCDAEVLRQLRRRTLARARDAVAPVDATTFGRFLPAWHGIGTEAAGAERARSAGARSIGANSIGTNTERLLEAIWQLSGLRLGWSQLERVLLPARVPGYRPADLDLLAATGQIVWVGQGAAGPRDGWITLFRRDQVLLAPAPETSEPSEDAASAGSVATATEIAAETTTEAETADAVAALRDLLYTHLQRRGACFLMELQQAAAHAGHRLDRPSARTAFDTALWDLVWSGQITNDTFAPLRALGGSRATAGVGLRSRGSAAGSALAGGRWSLVADLVAAAGPQSPTERLLAQARMLLGRYGIVSREAVAAEGLPGGFGPLYRVFKQMEEQGQVRRGHFVEGLSGAQFASPGALDQLRGARLEAPPLDGFGADALTILAAADPANPYGALLPWPATAGGQVPRRAAGCTLFLVAGRPVLYLGVGARQLLSFPVSDDDHGALDVALRALHRLPRTSRGRFAIRQIDGQPALASPLQARLLAAGFEPDGDALIPIRDPGRYPAQSPARAQ